MQFLHESEDLFGIAPVEIAGRLVGKEQARLHGQSARDRNPLLLSTGQLVGEVVRTIVQRDCFQEFPRTGARSSGIFTRYAQRQRDVIEGIQFVEQIMVLKHKTNHPVAQMGAFLAVETIHLASFEEERSLVRSIEQADEMQQRALADT